MGQETATDAPAASPSAAELEFRRYEARLGVWKVVLGTLIVGLAGVLIPGAISFYSAYFENARKETELRLSQQTAHQQYIKDFFATAINQDIELRIRFADYFANLSGPDQEKLWKNYLENLKKLRDDNRQKINDLEKGLVDFKKLPPDQMDNAEFDRINRELAWANAEIGYVPSERSTVIASAESSPIDKKTRLYKETTDLVQRLASDRPPTPADLARFWNLYRRDLISVESPEFARTMIAIGRVLQSSDASNSPSNPELKRLADELVSISRRELVSISALDKQIAQQLGQLQQQAQTQTPQQQEQQQQLMMIMMMQLLQQRQQEQQGSKKN
jgi:hypothetical protein